MNLSLTRLSLRSNTGHPILSLPCTLARKSFGFSLISAWKSFSPFLIGDSSSNGSLDSSHFASFLSPVLHLIGTDQTIINDTSSLSIRGTLFENSSIEDRSICALIHIVNGWIVTITDCLFNNNYGKYRSSSIYTFLSVMNVSCLLFTKCRTDNNGNNQDGNAFLFVDCISKVNDCLFYQSWIEESADGVYEFHRGKSITKRVNSTDSKANNLGESAGTAYLFIGDTTFEFIHGERGYGHNFLFLYHQDRIMRFADTFNVINGTYENSLLFSESFPTTFKHGFLFGNNRNNLGEEVIAEDCFGDFPTPGVTQVSFTLTHSISFRQECNVFPSALFSFKPYGKLYPNKAR